MRDATGPPTGIGPHRDEDQRQLQRETEERLVDAEALRKWLDRNPTEQRNLERVIQALRAMDAAGGQPDPGQIAALKRAVELMRQVEQELALELDRLSNRERYLYAEDNEAPPAYRRLVEEYYKAIAREKK